MKGTESKASVSSTLQSKQINVTSHTYHFLKLVVMENGQAALEFIDNNCEANCFSMTDVDSIIALRDALNAIDIEHEMRTIAPDVCMPKFPPAAAMVD